jgi:GntR family transcriptional regulator
VRATRRRSVPARRRRGRSISVAGSPERGAVVQRARELVSFARSNGYRVDDLVRIIEDVG